MTQYVALLRGIAPMNPNMRNVRLREVCADLGYDNVKTVVSSGNVLFETDSQDGPAIEIALESAWPERLGFESTTIVRTRADLGRLVAMRPFADLQHGPASYLLVTFAKSSLNPEFTLPHQPEGKDYQIVKATERELFSVTDTTTSRTPDVMSWLEGAFGKEITSRTWLTVTRIVKMMDS